MTEAERWHMLLMKPPMPSSASTTTRRTAMTEAETLKEARSLLAQWNCELLRISPTREATRERVKRWLDHHREDSKYG